MLHLVGLMSYSMNLTQPGTYTRGVKAILLNRILLVLAFVGLFVASALSLEKVLNISLPCGNNTGCDIIASDPSSALFGVPVAYFGFFGYVMLAGLAIMRTLRTPYDLRLVSVGLIASVIGTIFSGYLQYQSFFRIHAVCPYCLTSAITMLVTLVVYGLLWKEVQARPLPETEIGKLDLWMVAGLPFAMVLILGVVSGLQPANKGLDRGKMETNEKSLIPDNPKVFGHMDAPVTIVEFADLCCHSCQETAPKVKAFAEANPSTVKIIFRHFPLKMHKLGSTAAAMGEYAAEKGRFWDFAVSVMGLMRQPDSVQELLDIAKSIGLDTADMQKRLSNKNDPIYDRVTQDMNVGHNVGVSATPTFIILAKGVPPVSAGPSDVLDKLGHDPYKKLLQGSG